MSEFTPLEKPAKSVAELPLMHPGRPVGRDDMLTALYEQLKSGNVVNIYGAGGSGKTSIAAALAAAYTQQPGGVLWLNVDNSPLAEYVVRVGRAYGITEITSNENPLGMVGAAATTLSQHKPFIVIDGNPDEEATEQFVRRCMGSLPGLVLSETELSGSWETMEIEPLDNKDAVSLFKQKSGIKDNSADATINEIVSLLEGLPFAIVIAARAMTASKQAPDAYLDTLRQIAEKAGTPQMTALTASYRALSNPLQGLLLMMGASFSGEASAELLGMVSGVSEDSVVQAMNVLSQLYLVEKFELGGGQYYRTHESVYTFAQALLKNRNQLEGLQSKFHDQIKLYAQKYSDNTPEAYTKLAVGMPNLIAAALWAAENGNRDTSNALVVALSQAGTFIKSCGYLHELLRLRQFGAGSTTAFPAYPQESLSLDDDDEDDDYDDYDDGDDDFDDEDDDFDDDFDDEDDDFDDEDDDDESFGDYRSRLGDYDPFGDVAPAAKALDDTLIDSIPGDTASLETIDIDQLRLALSQAKQQSNMLRQIQILKAIGKVQTGQNKEDEAITTYTELLTSYETLNDDEGILETLDELSSLLTRTDNSQAAIHHVTRGIQLAEELDDHNTRMNMLMTLGDARQNLGESADAMNAYEDALGLSRSHFDEENEALILFKLGYAQLDDGEASTAIETWEEALKLFKTQDRRNYEGRVLGGIGQAYSDMELWSESIQFHKSALYIAREVSDREEEALQLSSLGLALVESGQLPEALTRYRQALHLAYKSDKQDDIVSAIVELVRLMLRSKRLLSICELLVDDALHLDPGDRDVKQLKEQIAQNLVLADANGIEQAPITGTAQDYAANAYRLLEQ